MISFVILNYNSFELTKECIKKIKKIKTKKSISIIVVDNNTLDKNEIKELKEQADKVIVNNENIGFAKANNIGINYAKNKYNSDFICVLNSDCFIEQETFIDNIYKIYQNKKFDLLGPKIISDNFLSWNPFPVYKTLNEINEKIKYHEKLLKIYKSKFLYLLLKLYLFLKFNNKYFDRNGKVEEENVALHGCCIIFSKKYLKKYNDAFYNDTFLYHEEEFLYYRMKKNKLVYIYDPKIEVYHLEGQATNKTYKNERKKLVFKMKEILNSLYKLKKIVENDSNI